MLCLTFFTAIQIVVLLCRMHVLNSGSAGQHFLPTLPENLERQPSIHLKSNLSMHEMRIKFV